MDSAGVGGCIAADGTGALARWIGGEVICGPAGNASDGVTQLHITAPRFDMGDAVFDIDLQHAIHPRGGDDAAVLERDAPACKTGAGPTRDDLHAMLAQELDDLDHLRGIGGEDDRTRPALGDGEAVAFVNVKFRRVFKKIAGGNQGGKIRFDEVTNHDFLQPRPGSLNNSAVVSGFPGRQNHYGKYM